MSVDAGLYLRWPDGQAPSAERLARMMGLPDATDHRGWAMAIAPDTCRMWVRISPDAGDRLGPYPGPDGTPEHHAERPYDHWLHISPSKNPPYAEDTLASLRAYCRDVVARLRHEGLVECAFDIDRDCYVSYWTAIGNAFGTETLPQTEITVRWAGSSEAAVRPTDLGRTVPPSLTADDSAVDALAAILIPTQAEATNGIAETIGLRATELPFHRTARFTGSAVPASEVDSFSDRLVAELIRPGQEVDVTVWVDGRLCRYEVAAQPLADLRVFE